MLVYSDYVSRVNLESVLDQIASRGDIVLTQTSNGYDHFYLKIRGYKDQVVNYFSRTEQLMSDVYDTVYYAIVVDFVDGKRVYSNIRYESALNMEVNAEEAEIHAAYLIRQKRISRAKRKLYDRAFFIQTRKELGLDNYHIVKRLFDVYNANTANRLLDMCRSLKKNRLRSKFNISIATQTLSWLNGENTYKTPLSPKQLRYVC